MEFSLGKTLNPSIVRAAFLILVTILSILGLSHRAYAQSQVVVKIDHLADATHIEFKGRDQWNYQFTKGDKNQMVLKISNLSTSSKKKLKSWKGPFINKISVVEENVESGFSEIRFQLNNAKIENFDYMTDKPSRVIIDFYKRIIPLKALKSKKPLIKISKKYSKKGSASNSKRKLAAKNIKGYNLVSRKPAGNEFLTIVRDQSPGNLSKAGKKTILKGSYDGSDPDFERFEIKDYEISEKAIIKSKRNIYIKFPVLKMEANHLIKILSEPPEYVIRDKDTDENQEAQFLYLLWKKNRPSKFIKVYKHFRKTYPDSEYMEIVDHIAADFHLNQYLVNGNKSHELQFRKIYHSLLSGYPDSIMNERTHLILAFTKMKSGIDVETARLFNHFIKTYKNSEYIDYAKIALADGLIGLKDYAGGMATYKQIQKTSKDYKKRGEAKYREGDIFFLQNKFEKTIATYQSAFKAYPGFRGVFPNAEYGLAEANFWRGNYRKALNGHIRFLKNFPEHKYGGYSMTRIGELLNILGADTSRSMMAFLESHFRYRDNPGAQVARVRLLSNRMRGMKEKEFQKAVKEVKKISNESELPLMSDFGTLLISDGLYYRKEYSRSLNGLISFYQTHQESSNLPYFHKRILKNIATKIKNFVNGKQFLQALKMHKKYSGTWLLGSDRIDVPFFIARAYEQAGVEWEAQRGYEKIIKQFSKIHGTREEKIRGVNEFLPEFESVKLRLAAVLVKQKKFINGEKALGKISYPQQLGDEDRIEYKVLKSNLALFRGRSKKARQHLVELISTWKGRPHKLMESYYKLAKLEYELGKYVKANKNIISARENSFEESTLDKKWAAKILHLKANIVLKLGRKIEAVKVFVGLINKFPEMAQADSIRYQAGKILFDSGDLNGAKKLWIVLQKKKGSLYSNLIKENLDSNQWEKNLKRYINRIPAVTQK